ncbi:AraC family transcriptional regulator [Acidocella sp. MX-AZ02]|uniref:helix-turn-helix domain-containing protein n=2 Tax=unclassified Acidocella TaxID=2648610 RepID=UPI00034AB5F1|nr:AraC family transcriptional regulator [Acidocella sp. MX-AZ02]
MKRDSLGCNLRKLICDQSLDSQYVRFYHKVSTSIRLGQIETPPADRGYLIGASMTSGHERKIFQKGQSNLHHFNKDAIYIRDFEDCYKADITGDFDFVLMELPSAAFQQLRADFDLKTTGRLNDVQASSDPVIGNLLRAMLPMFERPAEYSPLVLDQLCLTIAAHLFQRYTLEPQSSGVRASFLSKRQESLAKEMLRNNLNGNLSVAEIAKACGVSAGHFNRSFRASTGHSPYQWLTWRRLEKARALLHETALSLAEISVDCGFTDQSHFTRVFSRAFGMPPGRWRRDA